MIKEGTCIKQTRRTHLWPGWRTHPMFKDQGVYWAVCNNAFDCSEWEHRDEERRTYESSRWVESDA